MEVQNAVKILNRHEWRDRQWRVNLSGSFIQDDPDTYSNQTAIIEGVDAIAIASWLELRQAVEPFIKIAQTVGDLPGMLGGVDMDAWRELAAVTSK